VTQILGSSEGLTIVTNQSYTPVIKKHVETRIEKEIIKEKVWPKDYIPDYSIDVLPFSNECRSIIWEIKPGKYYRGGVAHGHTVNVNSESPRWTYELASTSDQSPLDESITDVNGNAIHVRNVSQQTIQIVLTDITQKRPQPPPKRGFFRRMFGRR